VYQVGINKGITTIMYNFRITVFRNWYCC